jgi:hypothetical protein
MSKEIFKKQASAYGVKATYSGANKTMFIKGDDKKVKSFIRVCNLKGTKNLSFAIAQS